MTVFRSIPQKDHEFDERQKVVVGTAQVNINEWKIKRACSAGSQF